MWYVCVMFILGLVAGWYLQAILTYRTKLLIAEKLEAAIDNLGHGYHTLARQQIKDAFMAVHKL